MTARATAALTFFGKSTSDSKSACAWHGMPPSHQSNGPQAPDRALPHRRLACPSADRAHQPERGVFRDADRRRPLASDLREAPQKFFFPFCLPSTLKSTTASVLLEAMSSCNPCSLAVSIATCVASVTRGSSSAAVSLMTGKKNRPCRREAPRGSLRIDRRKRPCALPGARSRPTNHSS